MAVEIIFFSLVFLVAVGLSILGYFTQNNIFLFLGCALLIGSGAILWGANGLIVSHYYDVDGVYQSNIVEMSNVGLSMFSLAIVSIGVLGVFSTAFSNMSSGSSRKSPYHY